MSFSIVIPVYNSQDSLPVLYQKIKEKFNEIEHEIIFVNDQSTDESLKVLKGLLKKDINVKILDMQENVGQQKALFYGLKLSKKDIVVTMDDDLQHPIALIDEMLVMIKEGADLVYAIPVDQHKNIIRRLGSSLTSHFFRKHYPNLNGKYVSSYRMMKRQVLSALDEPKHDYVYLSALLLNKAPKVENIFFDSLKRPYGRSGYSIKKLLMIYLKLNYYYYYKEKFYKKHKSSFVEREGFLYENNHDFRRWPMSD